MPLSSYYKQYDDINKAELERQKEVYKQLAETQKAQANQNADYAIKKIEDAADAQIKEAQSAYDGVIRTANVQRLIDERKVSERIANLGMTDSGLNRTQQTAVQLNRTNAINKAELARQKQIDALALEVTRQAGDINIQRQNTLTELDTQNQAYLLGLEEKYNANRNAWATGAYEADMDAEAKRYAAEQSAAASRYKAQLDYDAKIAKEAEANEIKRLEDKEKLIEKLYDEDLSDGAKTALAQNYYNKWGNDYEIHNILTTPNKTTNKSIIENRAETLTEEQRKTNAESWYNGNTKPIKTTAPKYEKAQGEDDYYFTQRVADDSFINHTAKGKKIVAELGSPSSPKYNKKTIEDKIYKKYEAGELTEAEVVSLYRTYSIT